jgi:hypothetical protein
MIDTRRTPFPVCARIVSLLLAGCLAGCEGANDEIPPGDPIPRQGSIRVVNAIPDAPRVTVLLFANAFADLDFGEASPLTKQLVGIYTMRFVYVNPDGDAIQVFPAERIELTQEDEVNFVLAGTWAQPQLLRFENIEIDFGVVARNDADVQVVHAATDSGAVDVYLTEAGADLATAAPLGTFAFGAVGDLVRVDAATNRQLRVTTAGTTNVLFDSGPFEISAFTRLVFLVRDYFGPGAATLRVTPVTAGGNVIFPSEPLQSSLRFANLVADAPSTDLYFVDTTPPPVFAGAAFGTMTTRQLFAPGRRDVKLTLAGSVTPFVAEGATTLVSGTYQTLFAGGLDGNDSAAFTTVIDDIRPIATETRLRLDHAAAAAGPVDVYILSPGEPITNATPEFASFGLNGRRVASLLAGTYDVTITRAGSKVSLAGPESVTVELGGVYTLALTDTAGGGAPVVLRRFDDLAP